MWGIFFKSLHPNLHAHVLQAEGSPLLLQLGLAHGGQLRLPATEGGGDNQAVDSMAEAAVNMAGGVRLLSGKQQLQHGNEDNMSDDYGEEKTDSRAPADGPGLAIKAACQVV